MRALWSAGWAVAAAAYFAAGGESSPITLGIMVAAVLLGAVVGTLRRWTQPLLGAWAAAIAIILIALIAWLDALAALLQLSTIAAVVAAAGFAIGAPPRGAEPPSRTLRMMTPALRGLALAVLSVGAGVTASVHIAWTLTVAAMLTIGWAVLCTRADLQQRTRRGGIAPAELLQGALIALGLGAWAVLALLIVPQLRFEIPWEPLHPAAVHIGLALGVGMLGAGLGFAAVVPAIERRRRPRAAWTLGPAAIGMLMLMIARPGSLAWLGIAGVAIVAFALAAAFRFATAAPPQRALDETVFAGTAVPAVLAAAAVGALAGGMLAGVAEDRDILLLPVAAVAIAAVWIDLTAPQAKR